MRPKIERWPRCCRVALTRSFFSPPLKHSCSHLTKGVRGQRGSQEWQHWKGWVSWESTSVGRVEEPSMDQLLDKGPALTKVTQCAAQSWLRKSTSLHHDKQKTSLRSTSFNVRWQNFLGINEEKKLSSDEEVHDVFSDESVYELPAAGELCRVCHRLTYNKKLFPTISAWQIS